MPKMTFQGVVQQEGRHQRGHWHVPDQRLELRAVIDVAAVPPRDGPNSRAPLDERCA